MIREIYVSHMEYRKTDTLTYIKKLEAVVEAAPQLIITTYYFLRANTLQGSRIEIIGWLWSFWTLSTKVIADDKKMYKRVKTIKSFEYFYRTMFRLCEICGRVLIIGTYIYVFCIHIEHSKLISCKIIQQILQV